MIPEWVRRGVRFLLTREKSFILEREVPRLWEHFVGLNSFGLYLHIPFCRQICPYCPYNKEIYLPHVAKRYTQAVLREIDAYARLAEGRPVTSFYIGGGTPTTMIDDGLIQILDHVYSSFNMQCSIHMESHPNDLTEENLEKILGMGVKHLSIGVEALQDHHLRTLQRPYTVDQVKAVVRRATAKDFHCVNVDFIFALPNQTNEEVATAAHELVRLGVDQIAAYPLFKFPYTRWASITKRNGYTGQSVFARRKMLSILEMIFYQAGYERTSVWAFTRKNAPKYCSVTVPQYIGLGASGGSYLQDVLYFNTFNVGEYIAAIDKGKLPIALSLQLSLRAQMAGWLYWRIYETRFRKSGFLRRFGQKFEHVYGAYMGLFSLLGFLKDKGDEIQLSDRGAYWLHVLQDLFSIDYIGKLWGTSKQEPWPDKVVL